MPKNRKRIFVSKLVCPHCHSELKEKNNRLLNCSNPKCNNSFKIDDNGIPFFAPDIDIGKYDENYANLYSGVWAYGYETMNQGENESLYRTVNEMILSNSFRDKEYTILDAGCGVGRTAGDCARYFNNSIILGMDASEHMLKKAHSFNHGDSKIEIDLSKFGFGRKVISQKNLENLLFIQADIYSLPLLDNIIDIGLSINIVDRVKDPKKVITEMYRVLKKGGLFLFSDPLNWQEERIWKKYPDAESILEMFTKIGFSIDIWFDGLFYREIKDARKSYEDWSTLIVQARK